MRFFFGTSGCIPTCGGSCVSGEVCTASSRDEQSCECTVGYERDDGGDCAWQGLIADPRFEQGCAHWRLYRQGGNAGDAIVVDLEPGALTLSVDHKCSFAMASAEAYVPTEAMQGAAIELTASGSSGAKLYVSFDEPEGLPQSVGMALIGTGERKSYVVCLPLWEQGLRRAITLTVGEGGVCAEALEESFVVHSLEVISDPACGATGR